MRFFLFEKMSNVFSFFFKIKDFFFQVHFIIYILLCLLHVKLPFFHCATRSTHTDYIRMIIKNIVETWSSRHETVRGFTQWINFTVGHTKNLPRRIILWNLTKSFGLKSWDSRPILIIFGTCKHAYLTCSIFLFHFGSFMGKRCVL